MAASLAVAPAVSWTRAAAGTGTVSVAPINCPPHPELTADGVSDWATIATTGQDVTVYTDAGLSAATTYFFRVFAENDAGDSPASNVASATTASEQQAPPSGQAPA